MHQIHLSAITSVGLLAIAGCADDPITAETTALTATSITFSANNALADEHCRVHTSRAVPWPAGHQLAIYRDTTLRGICTIDGGGTIDAGTIEMSRAMMKDRVWISGDGMDPVVTTQIVSTITGVTVRDETPSSPAVPRITAPVTTLAGLETDGDNTLREYTTTPTGTTGVLVGYTAPHPTENPAPSGGFGRSYLGWKAAQAKLDAAHDAFWTPGWRGNRGHCIADPENPTTATICDTKRFHITATEVSSASYPGLATLAAVDLDYAVALHGQGSRGTICNTNIMVGGLAGTDLASDSLGFRRGVAENLRLLVPPETTAGDGKLVPDRVKYSHAGNLLDSCSFDEGIRTTNYVNALAQDGTVYRGLELEQGSALAAATYQAVGESVHQIFDCLNATPDVTVGTVPSSFAPRSSSAAGYATDGNRCNGFLVDATFSVSSASFFGGLQTCQVGGKVHLDVYHRNASGSWDRVAGGTRSYTACNPAVFSDATYDDDGAAPAPSFQHALTGAASAGDFRLVIYGYSGAYFTPATALPVFGQAS